MEDKIDLFIEYIRNERNYSDYTEENYLMDLNDYESYLKQHRINYLNINYKEITVYIAYLKEIKKLNSSSINRHLSAIRSFYNYICLRNYIKSNPFSLVKGPKKELKLPNYMKYSEFELMINSCDDSLLGIRNKAILEILLATGARIGELINVDINNINFSSMEIKVLGKGNKERICYFNNHCKDALLDYINNSRNELLNGKTSSKLFINHLGNPLTTRGVRDILDKIILKSCVNSKITPHTFRHTFATMLLNEGCDIKSVQELLGHVNLSTTSIYTHVTNDRIKDIYLHTHPRNKK